MPDQAVIAAVKAGICKINVHTQLNKSFTEKIREIFKADPDTIDLRKYLGAARESLMEEVRAKIRLFGASGKAPGVREVAVGPEEYTKQEIVE